MNSKITASNISIPTVEAIAKQVDNIVSIFPKYETELIEIDQTHQADAYFTRNQYRVTARAVRSISISYKPQVDFAFTAQPESNGITCKISNIWLKFTMNGTDLLIPELNVSDIYTLSYALSTYNIK